MGRIQRLRKNTGISIEDQIEIYYEYQGSASADSMLGKVMKEHGAKIESTTKMPLGTIDELNNPYQRFIGSTEYVCQELSYDNKQAFYKWKDIPDEVVKIHIYLAGPKYDDAKLEKDFGENAADIKTYLAMFDADSLKNQLDKDGSVRLVINDKEMEIKRGVHFYLNLSDKRQA